MTSGGRTIGMLAGAILACALFIVCAVWGLRSIKPTPPPPYSTPEVIQGEEGIDWEDCINGEPDCFLNRRKITPTVKPTSVKPSPVRTTGKPAPARTTRR